MTLTAAAFATKLGLTRSLPAPENDPAAELKELLALCERQNVGVGPARKDDGQLIDEALDGNSAAFGQLVTKYQDRLYNALLHVVGSSDAACDAVQDAFVQAYVKLETFERASAFYTWLYRIAFNLAISRRRRQRPTVSIEQARESSGHDPIDRGDPPGGRLEQQERAAQVEAALTALSEEHRGILVLREIEEFSYEQISEILDLPVGTIRSRLHRARLQLRDQLKTVMQEDVK